MRQLFVMTLLAALLLVGSGCAKVQPWQKGNLARKHMAFDPDTVEARYAKKTYQSKEASSGGYSVGGGGCGCN